MADDLSPILNGQRILIAEDEAIIVMLLQEVIELLGGQIVNTAKSCGEARTALENETFDAIILDVHLKGGTSETVVTAATGKGIPVLVCTGSDPQTLSPVFRELPLLQKPFRGEDVEIALARLLGIAK